MAGLLMIKGDTAEDACAKVNQTEYAKDQQLNLDDKHIEDNYSVQSLTSHFSGLKSLCDKFESLFQGSRNFSQAITDLKQRQALLLTGWAVYKSMPWMSWLYLVVLSSIIGILNIYVVPQFSEMFSNFGADLPPFTQFYFQDGTTSIILLVMWMQSLAYLWLVWLIKKSIKNFRILPGWLSKIPILGSIADLLNKNMSLSTYRFLANFKEFELPEKSQWLDVQELTEGSKHFKWAEQTYQYLTMAIELGLLRDYLENELNRLTEEYVSKTASTMKLISISATFILAVLVASIVIAMYLPLFKLGSII